MTPPEKPSAPAEPAWKTCKNCKDQPASRHSFDVPEENDEDNFGFPVAKLVNKGGTLRCPLCQTQYSLRSESDPHGFMGQEDLYLTRIG